MLLVFFFSLSCTFQSTTAKQSFFHRRFEDDKKTSKKQKKYSNGDGRSNKKQKESKAKKYLGSMRESTLKMTNLPRYVYGTATDSRPQRLEKSSTTVKPLQPTIDIEPKCFQDATGATLLGTLILDAMWEEIKRTKHCHAEEIKQIWDAYFRQDLIVQDQTDAIIINSLEEYKQEMMEETIFACLYQDVSFEPTQEATTEPGIFDDFAWTGNRSIQDPSSATMSQSTTRKEIYLIELLGASGSFVYTGKEGGSKKGSSSSSSRKSKSNGSPFFYSYHGKGGSGKYGREHQCHRPQIYGIVIF